jgi:hypothetical protein
MEIKAKWGKAGDGPEKRVTSITIEVGPGDDPDGHISGLISRGRLEAFLRAYARPHDLGAPEDKGEAYALLSGFAYVANMCTDRREAMQLAARDQWGMGWGTIAAAAERSRSTVKGQVQSARTRYAEVGDWWDAGGLHHGTPEQAAGAGLRARRQDGQE